MLIKVEYLPCLNDRFKTWQLRSDLVFVKLYVFSYYSKEQMSSCINYIVNFTAWKDEVYVFCTSIV